MKKYLVLPILIFVLNTAVGAQPTDQLKRASQLFDQGLDHYRNNRYDAAIASYTEYLKIRPTVAVAWYNRGLAYKQKADAAMSRPDYERALADLSRAVELDPKDSDAWLNRGFVRLRLVSVDFNKQVPLALADFTRAIKLKPATGDAYTGRGQVYVESNRRAEAMADLNKALKLNPNDYVAFYTRGKLYAFDKKYDLARSDLENALRLYPGYPQARSQLDLVNDEVRKTSVVSSVKNVPATPVSGQIIDLADGFNKTEAAERAGSNAQVVELATRTLQFIPMLSDSIPKNDLETSIYLALLSKRAKALSNLGKYTESDDGYGAHSLAALKNMNRYMDAGNQTLKADKIGSSAGWILAKIEVFKGVQVCKRGLAAGDEWSGLITKTRPNDQMTALRAAIMHAAVRENCSTVYMMYGDYQAGADGTKAMIDKGLSEALESYNEAVRLAPREARAYKGRAVIYRKLGRADLAVADEQKAASLPAK